MPYISGEEPPHLDLFAAYYLAPLEIEDKS